jgi:hypothetical protein
MKYKISKSFQKDLAKINDRRILAKVRKCIEGISTSNRLSAIANLEPMANYTRCPNCGLTRRNADVVWLQIKKLLVQLGLFVE